jgi:hypothetical protein
VRSNAIESLTIQAVDRDGRTHQSGYGIRAGSLPPGFGRLQERRGKRTIHHEERVGNLAVLQRVGVEFE